MDLRQHVLGNNESGYIPTSIDEAISVKPEFSGQGNHVYEIDSRVGGKLIDYDELGPSFADFYSHELEVPVPNAILPRDIIGARPVLPGGRLGPFIPNPNYVK